MGLELARVGRPREFDQTVSVRLPRATHDELCREARRRGLDVADVMRERLARGSFVSQKSRRDAFVPR